MIQSAALAVCLMSATLPCARAEDVSGPSGLAAQMPVWSSTAGEQISFSSQAETDNYLFLLLLLDALKGDPEIESAWLDLSIDEMKQVIAIHAGLEALQ